MQIKTIALVAGALTTLAAAGVAQAAAPAAQAVAPAAPTVSSDDSSTGFKAGDILVRARGLAVLPTVDNGRISAIGGNVNASSSFIPEADVSYFFTKNIAVEAIAGITRHHVVDQKSAAGNVDLGHVDLLPPTITAQYHFLPTSVVNPYLGAGLNYTFFLDHTLPAGSAATAIHYDNGFHTAIQAGADFHIQGNWYANIDVKHIFLTTHVKIDGGAIAGDVSIDPTIVGAGIGYKF